jgi:acylphosphatase
VTPAPPTRGPATGPPLVRRRVVVRGRVQGVFFRDTLRRRAEARNVTGWVTNRGDGAVEAALEGRRADVEALVGFCRQGPARAEVETVEIRDEEPEGSTEFKIE